MDRIIIKNAELFCKIGVSAKERSKKQKIFADAELFFDLKKAASADDIKKTISYSEVCASMKKISGKKEYNLIETLAEKIAEEILLSYPAKKIILKVKKPLGYAEYAAVEITRKNG